MALGRHHFLGEACQRTLISVFDIVMKLSWFLSSSCYFDLNDTDNTWEIQACVTGYFDARIFCPGSEIS